MQTFAHVVLMVMQIRILHFKQLLMSLNSPHLISKDVHIHKEKQQLFVTFLLWGHSAIMAAYATCLPVLFSYTCNDRVNLTCISARLLHTMLHRWPGSSIWPVLAWHDGSIKSCLNHDVGKRPVSISGDLQNNSNTLTSFTDAFPILFLLHLQRIIKFIIRHRERSKLKEIKLKLPTGLNGPLKPPPVQVYAPVGMGDSHGALLQMACRVYIPK